MNANTSARRRARRAFALAAALALLSNSPLFAAAQVAPAELEAVLLTHQSVADAAVIPSPDDEAGEVPKAFVVVREGHGLTEDEVLCFVAARVAPHKKVRRVEFVAQVPKSPSGKILRRLLVERERSRGAH